MREIFRRRAPRLFDRHRAVRELALLLRWPRLRRQALDLAHLPFLEEIAFGPAQRDEALPLFGLVRTIKRILLRAFGCPVRCELCGQTLFKALPIVRRGKIKLIGAEYALVRVDFDSMNHLSFRHVQADRCPSLRATL